MRSLQPKSKLKNLVAVVVECDGRVRLTNPTAWVRVLPFQDLFILLEYYIKQPHYFLEFFLSSYPSVEAKESEKLTRAQRN